MKSLKGIFSIALLALFAVANVTAQDDKGTITLEITDVTSDNPQVAAFAEGMKGSETIVFFRGAESLTRVNMMGGMVKIDVKIDAEENSDMLMDAMGNKIWVPSTKLEQARMKAESDNPMDEMEISYDKADTKEIAGYQCYKMTVEFPDAEDSGIVGYVTEAITIRPNFIRGVDISEFEGFPLEFTFSNPQMNMTMSTKSIETTLDESVFDLNTSGYQKMTMAEFAEMSRGMGF